FGEVENEFFLVAVEKAVHENSNERTADLLNGAVFTETFAEGGPECDIDLFFSDAGAGEGEKQIRHP
ncbi:MAG: hypothetical protein WBD95_08975, partial [Xanthobacteraceae bacterium]